ncbi:MAG: mechanosensitive ion channel family protein [Acidimicrobiia bacterium]|nr:mechanosensitive ion channel family protein [Acidimicrobiia bacterium]
MDAVNPQDSALVNWLVALATLMVGIFVAMVAKRAIARLFRSSQADTAHVEVLVARLVQVIIIMIALIYALGAVGVRISPLLGALGIGGIALALAVQPALLNLFSGLLIHVHRPLKIGEEVRSGDIRGTVIDVTSRAVVIETFAGETTYIPNSIVVDREVVNYVRAGRRRTTLKVGVAYGTDVALARKVLEEAAAGVDGVLKTPAVKVFATEFADSSINFELDVWHEPGELALRQTRDRVVQAVSEALAAADITIPFPQRTLWFGEPSDSRS